MIIMSWEGAGFLSSLNFVCAFDVLEKRCNDPGRQYSYRTLERHYMLNRHKHESCMWMQREGRGDCLFK